MTMSVMTSTIDDSLAVLLGLLSLAIGVALYIWLALALSAMFRKMGEQSWKGWVPVLNQATVLTWGGFSPWLVLLVFVPIVGWTIVAVLLIVSAHRINPGFGYGAGMTVLSAFLFVVWASILGFGPAPWRGARTPLNGMPQEGMPVPAAGVPLAAAGAPAVPPMPPLPPSAAAPGTRAAARESVGAPVDIPPFTGVPASAVDATVSAADLQRLTGATPPPAPLSASAASASAPAAPATTASAPAASRPGVPGSGASGSGAAPASPATPAVPPPPAATPTVQTWAPPAPSATPPAPASGDAAADIARWPSEIDEVSAISPSPFPPSAAAAGGARHVPAPVDTGDDGVISFVPGRRSTASEQPAVPVNRVPAVAPAVESPSRPDEPRPAQPQRLEPRPAASVPGTGADAGPVPLATPTPAATAADPANAAPVGARSALRPAAQPEADAFPELSGEVSAVVGSPAAGAPRSALNAVSAQHRRQDPEPEVEDEADQTVIVRRKPQDRWQLVPASGSPIALTGDVVILGRRPSADAAFPGAQLVAVEDDARTVSKTHARIQRQGERWLITDLHSTNGVLLATLMGEEVEIEPGTELSAGERFFLGDEEFQLQHLTD